MAEVSLRIEGQLFQASKEALMEHSEYFRAMFSGHYRENNQDIVDIKIVDAKSMMAILTYLEIGEIEFKDPQSISDLAASARFLQIDKLMKMIEYFLTKKLDLTNWIVVLDVAEGSSMDTLAQMAAGVGLYSFESMTKHEALFKTPSRLHWYLAHSHLLVDSELDIFDFGVQWIEQNEVLARNYPDLILLIIGCLDIAALLDNDLLEISKCPLVTVNKKADDIISCLKMIKNESITVNNVTDHEEDIRKAYSDEIFEQVMLLVKESVSRAEVKQPCVSLRYRRREPGHKHGCCEQEQILYKWSNLDKHFEPFLEIAQPSVWGFSVAVWGTHKLVVTGGEISRGTGVFEQRVRVWNSLFGEWDIHDTLLNRMRHASTVVHGDTLYIVGGVGAFRIILNTVYAYDLVKQAFHELPRLPFIIQSPAIAIHKGHLYVGSPDDMLYMLQKSQWVTVVRLNMRPSFLVPFGDSIYMTQSYQRELGKFNVEEKKVEHVFEFNNYVAGLCNTGRQLFAFTELPYNKHMHVETVTTVAAQMEPEITWIDPHYQFMYNTVAGCPVLALDKPPIYVKKQSRFALQYLPNVTSVD